MEPPPWAQGLIGASGKRLTVRGQLRRVPFLLNDVLYHANLVVAHLGAVNAILGMDFLKAYGAVINLETNQVSMKPSVQINSIGRESLCLEPRKVVLSKDSSMKGRSLNRLHVQVVEKELEGVYLFEPTICLDEECYVAEQTVNVVMGAFDILRSKRSSRGAGDERRTGGWIPESHRAHITTQSRESYK